ncbi:hypothetical protein HYV57_02235 [Candidatus Peregrinibacteria bacterium]|nr:hypothetical protein [Candidatus Peregrinibacteria bacterium]
MNRIQTFRDACSFLEKRLDYAENKNIFNRKKPLKKVVFSRNSRISNENAENIFNLESFRHFLKTVHIVPHAPIILIAGSKGKGSVAHILERLLASDGLKTGLFTSPFLYDIREMIRVSHKPIHRSDFTRLLSDLQPALEKHPNITRFEIITAMAFRFFSEQNVDAMILEVGLGGRLDATNVYDPALTILTSMEAEHTRILGKTIQSILLEKLGITRENIPLIVGKQSSRVYRCIDKYVKKKKIPLVRVSDFLTAENSTVNRQGTFFDLVFSDLILHSWGEKSYKKPLKNAGTMLPKFTEKALKNTLSTANAKIRLQALHGDVFVENALIALTAFLVFKASSVKIFELVNQCRKVFSSLRLPGHFEIRSRKGKPFILDVLHTPKSARAFRQTLDRVFPNQPRVFLAAFLEDKKKHRILHTLMRPDDVLVLTSLHHPRAYNSQSLYNFFVHRDMFRGRVFFEKNMKNAFHKIFSLQSQSFLPCIIGSHYLLREAKKQGFLS